MKAVLYVDDDPNDVLLFQSACRLARVAFRLRTAAGGPEAIGYLGGEGEFANRTEYPLPDFVLLDLKMPGKDGFEVLRWMRANPATRAIPVVLYTASLIREDIVRGHAAGASWFITKPSDMSMVVNLAQAIDLCLTMNPANCESLARFAALS